MDDKTLIGREKELEKLHQILERVSGGHGGVLLVAGEAGVGKTRLVEDALAGSGLHILTGRARPETPTPYGPIASVLRSSLDERRDDDVVRGPLAPHLAMLLPELGPSPRDADPHALAEAIISVLVAQARVHALVVFLDDLHCADNATVELIPALADRIDGEPLLVLATYRNDEIQRGHPIRRLRDDLRRARRLREITVGPLERARTAALLESALGSKPGSDLVTLVFEKTHGIPLYVEELARALVSGGRLDQSGGRTELVSDRSLPIPESIRDSVLLRLDGLSESARNALDAAAVTGVEFDMELVGRIAGDEVAIEELIDRNWILETAAGVGSFRHELIRDAVRSEIAWSKRRSLSRRIAAYLEREGAPPERVAEHWLAAKEHEAACRALLDLAERSCRLHAYRDAAAAAHRALEIWPSTMDESRRLDALQQLAHCAQVSGQLGDAVRARREVADSARAAGDLALYADAMRDLATVYGLQGSTEHAVAARTAAAEAYEAAGRHGDAAAEWLVVAARATANSALDHALQVVRKAAALAERANRPGLVVRAKGFEGNLLAMLGEFQAGRELAQEALSLALAANQTDAASDAYRRLASVLDYGSDFSGSRDAYLTAVNYCRTQGDDQSAQVCLGCMSAIVYRTGEWKRALETAREVSADAHAALGSRAVAQMIGGLIRANRGEIRAARKCLQRATALAHDGDTAVVKLMCVFGAALVAELEGDAERAAELHQQVLDGWHETQDRHDLIPFFLWQATFFAMLGREHETTQRADVLARVASATGNPETVAALAHALGEVSLLNERADEAADHFARALSQAEKLDIPLELAIISWRFGVALATRGDRDAAIRHLTNAYRIARRLGARPIAGRIAEALQGLGERIEEGRHPSETARSDRAGLTRRQLEIVRLLADGLTNKEIAARLYVSRRTVDMHISHILDRLDCASRTEAARKAAELGLLR